MSGSLTIALDVMGGDHGPQAVIPGAALALSYRPGIRFLLVGDEKLIRPLLEKYPDVAKASEIIHTEKAVSADDKPGAVLRNGRETSMWLAITAVTEGRANAIVSGGNTGALMVTARMLLKCLPGIDRPAIASVMPTMEGEVVMLDLGANLECTAGQLVQFAVLGAVFSRVVRKHDAPTVGLLNIGSEDMKGHDEIREASAILQKIKFPGVYKGFVEGNDIARGTVDVVVTDGFTGNVALKTAEGVGKLATRLLKDALKSSPLAMLGAILASGALRKLKNQLDPRLYNGGMFLGLNGVCVKSHGSMDEVGIANAIKVAADIVALNYNTRVAADIASVIEQESFFQESSGSSAAAPAAQESLKAS
jgi:glycerol-3-phosphate acyltransferase PlsX